uniref:Uncharacterized protein n=1 Tax=Plectus sambesii TaxID=2011161 RepID=A0A914XM29_9BILA
EGSGAKIDCHEPDHYPKTLSFSWMLGGSTNQFVPQSSRVFISRDGTLLFSFVKAEDANSYACTVSNSQTQSGYYGPFFGLIVTARPATASSAAAPRIDGNFLKVFPSKPHIGHDAYLECFAYGRPSPTYSWSKVDGHLANNSVISNFGRVLKLISVTKEQAGVYRCTASNLHGEITADVTVSLQSAPVFLKLLVDRSVSVNSTVRLRCDTFAVPAATIEWFKDGTPVSPLLMSPADQHRYIVNESTLTISPAFESDSAVYQCIATNSAGFASSSALLVVQNFPPTIDRSFVRAKHVAFEGSNVTISCANHASPKATVTWHRAGILVEDRGRLRRSKNGSLVIDDVLNTDAGEYVCTANNLLGFDSISVTVIVMAKPTVRLVPNEIYVPQNANATLSCKIDAHCSADCPEMLHDWTFNAVPLHSLHPFANIHPTMIGKFGLESQISLPSKMGNNRIGRFVCSTIAGAEAADVKLFPLPLAPIQTTISEIGATWVRLSWQQPSDLADTTIEGYSVEYRTEHDLNWRPLPAGRVMISTRQVHQFQLDGILPYVRYQFRVKTRGANGFGEPSAPSDWQKTRAIRPTEQVKAIRHWSATRNDLVAEWEPLLKINHNGPNLRYIVRWADNGHMKDNQSVTTSNAKVMLHIQDVARDCQPFYFTVQPVNDLGVGPVSRPIKATLSLEGVTRAATNVSASLINATHVKFSWEWTAISPCDGSVLSEIKCETNAKESIASTVSIEQTTVVLSNFLGATKYDCNIVAIDRKGRRGADGQRISFTTFESPPEIAPFYVHLYPEGSDSARLEWSPVPLDMLAVNKSQGYQASIAFCFLFYHNSNSACMTNSPSG